MYSNTHIFVIILLGELHIKMACLESLSEFKNSQHRILAPAVGFYSMAPRHGTLLAEGSFIGRLKILNSIYELYLPAGIEGIVVVDQEMDKLIPVEYGQELFKIDPDTRVQYTKNQIETAETADPLDSEQGFIITAFTTGIFYGKSSPDSEPFVSVGQEIQKGKILGLIEVMKMFNQIIFQGTDTSDSGRIKRIYVKDNQEVKLGQKLFLIE